MAYLFSWPTILPQKPQQNYTETGGVLLLRTSQDRGPAKQRRLGKRINELRCSFHMSSSQVQVLEDFIENSIKGTIRFGFPHPRKNTIVEARIVPQENGLMYTVGYLIGDVWNVDLTFEVLP